MNHVHDAKKSVLSFVARVFDELGSNLKAAQPGSLGVGLSFDPNIVVGYVPLHEVVRRGLYDCCDGRTHVEVLHQDVETGLIHLEIYDEEDPSKRFDFISTGMFLRLFKPKPVIEYVMGKAPHQSPG